MFANYSLKYLFYGDFITGKNDLIEASTGSVHLTSRRSKYPRIHNFIFECLFIFSLIFYDMCLSEQIVPQ